MTDWRENTGVVPPEVGPDTVVEVEYRSKRKLLWRVGRPDLPFLWSLDGHKCDVIRWRIPE